MLFQKNSFFQKNQWLLTGLSMLLLLLLSSCSILEETLDVSKPKASISGVAIESLSTQDVTLLVAVEVTNPNSFDLKTAGFDLGLFVNDQRIAIVAQPDASLSLPAKGSSSIQLPVTLTFEQVMKSVDGLNDRTGFSYGVEGKVTIDLPILGDFNMPVDFSGVLPIPQQPGITFKGLNVDSISVSGARLSMDLEVSNPNAFDIDLNNVNYQLKAQGKSLGEGKVKAINLSQGKTQRLSIPLSISVSDMGTSLYQLLISSNPIAADVSVSAEVDTNISGWKSTPLSIDTQQILSR